MNKSSTYRALTLGLELIDDPNWMGGVLYLRNLALCLSCLPQAERPMIHLLGTPSTVAAFIAEHPGVFSPKVANRPNSWQRLLRKLRLSHTPVDGEIDVVYPGFGSAVPGVTTIRWIPDFQHRHLPHLFSGQEIAARDRSISAIAEKPGIVVLSSKVAADDFRRFFPNHVATPRVWHFHSLIELVDGSEEIFDALRVHNLPQKYLYLPNQLWVHKNHITVLRALLRLRNREGLVIPLVCTGTQSDRRNSTHFRSLQAFIHNNGMADQIYMLGLLPRGEQIAVMRAAAAVVQPSLFEGWSTVVEDARACGRPIFLSDIPVHREQSPPYAIYFAPEDSEKLADILAQEWPILRHGPDQIAEDLASKETEKLTVESAQTFCKIVEEAFALGSPI